MATAQAFGTRFQLDRVDKDAGVIKGVAVVTSGFANGGVMDAISLSQIKTCCETYANGLKVVDRHTKGTDSIFATAGTLKNFRIEAGKLLADLHLLKTEPNAPKLLEMAETMPDTFGLSVAFSGVDEVINGEIHWRCSEIYNAALVDVPAANPTGLFSRVAVEVPVHFVDAPAKTKTATTMSNAIGAEGTNISDSTGATVTPDNLTVRVQKLEATISALEKKFADMTVPPHAEPDGDEIMSRALGEVKTLSAAIDVRLKEFAAANEAKIVETIQRVAKEFAANTGVSPRVASDGAGTAGDTRTQNDTSKSEAANPAKLFGELVAKKFAECKSKVKALQLAIEENPAGYAAFRTSGLNIRYS